MAKTSPKQDPKDEAEAGAETKRRSTKKRAAKKPAGKNPKNAASAKPEGKEPTAKKASKKKATEKKQDEQKAPAKSAKSEPDTKPVAKRPRSHTSQRKQAEDARPNARRVSIPEDSASLAARIERAELPAKLRVHALAKMIGLPSRELVAALAELGIKKVAQSTLAPEQTAAFLDAVTPPAATEPAAPSGAEEDGGPAGDTRRAEGAKDTPEEVAIKKVRHQVEKGVANEIHQIEDKVEKELAAEQARQTEQAANTADAVRDADPAERPSPAEDSGSAEEDDEPSQRQRRGRRATTRRGRRGAGRGRRAASSNTKGESREDAPVDAEAGAKPKAPRKKAPQPAAEPAEPAKEKGSAVEQALDDSQGELPTEPVALKGSTRLEAKRRRRSEKNEEARTKRHVLTEEEFLARRESVKREMIVRERQRHDHPGTVVQVGVLEDDLLVEHFVTSETQSSVIGNLYLGRVQNVLPSMEAAFIDIGQGRNGVLYAGEVDWRAAGIGGRSRRIEQALKSGDQVVVQVTKDPMGHKGARLTTQVSLAGRYLVYVPGGRSAGISRKLPAEERSRLKKILKKVMPEDGGAIIRTAAEGVSEEAIAADVRRLHRQWEDIQEHAAKEKKSRGRKPVTLYEEPPMLVKVVRDLFNEDFTRLVVDGDRPWNTVSNYVESVAPDLADRLERFHREEHGGRDAFEVHRVDEQIDKALGRIVYLPSGGSLVIDRTEAMTVIDVNTGRFTGSGGNLEETVTSNNLEAAEEIVRQLRLRDIGGMIVIDFIDMVLPENRELVLRRLAETLSRDRTRHQVSEVTSLGLVQVTRKRLGTGLIETFSTPCECCRGRGIIVHEDPVELDEKAREYEELDRNRKAAREEEERRREEGEEHARRGQRSRRGPGRGRGTVEQAEEAREESRSKEAAAHENEGHGFGFGVAEVGRDGEAGGRGRGRGGRRRGMQRRGRGSDEELEKLAASVISTEEDPAETSRPEGPTLQGAGDAEAEFEAAVEKFERSPRRRRRTRGNSRSDRRPQRADFPDEQAPQATTCGAEQDASSDKEEPRDGRAEARVAKPSRGSGRAQAVEEHARAAGKRTRRRAARRSATRRDEGTRVAQGQEPRQAGRPEQASRRAAQPRSRVAEHAAHGGRSRRRAARRSARR